MKLIKATNNDVSRIMQIIQMAKLHLKEQNIDQWQDGYPNIENIENDIFIGKGYVLVDNDEIIAYVLIDFDEEVDYRGIDGLWNTPLNSMVLHRIAMSSNYRGKGLSEILFNLAFEIAKGNNVFSVRVDTHKDNKKMQHILKKNGFKYCGIVIIRGNERIGFDKVL